MAHVICKSELVERCRAFAKALHYKEMEFEGALSKKMDANPVAVVEALIHSNTQGCVWFAFRYTHNPKRGVVLVSVNKNTQGMLVFGSRFTATPQSGVWLRLSHHRLLNGDLNGFSVNTCVLVELIFQLLSSIKGAYFQVCMSLSGKFHILFGFETWMVVEHDKLGHRLDSLNEMFWLMTFLESASLIGSQVLANWLISSNDIHKNMVSPSTATAILALLCIIYIARE
ncbi:Major facilitator superfamily domain, general substrate transporter [Artemisia annua]|uniref:Major facilitator superfamily domain, general substrate transporter n=1 Tax=Artemisia annua TaxID=35608 RepID=A0A2U1MW20_ARTAN|nr:Major facilitator superfamily domain, general substrate transporter [Artemisia annua]